MSVLAQTLKYMKTILFAVMARISYVLMNDLVNHKKPNIDEDAIEKFFNYIISETEYCAKVIEREFNKPLVMTKKDHEDFKSSTKC